MSANRRAKLPRVGRGKRIGLWQKILGTPFKVSIHPLFLLVGIWYCFIGRLPLFFLSAIVALQHECAHAFAAAKLGYRLDKVVLMPYGAVIDGDLSGLSLKDEAYVALCGPLTNLATSAFFVALWWIWPSLYPYTDVACYTSAFIGFLNFLPTYPLDGGRVVLSLLTRLFLRKHPPREASKRAKRWCLAISLCFCAGLIALFVWLCTKGEINVTLLAFILFLGVGSIGHFKDKAEYTRMDYSFKEAFRRGVFVKHVAVDDDCTVKQALRFLDERHYVAFEIYDKNERLLGTLSQNRLADKFAEATLYEPLVNLL